MKLSENSLELVIMIIFFKNVKIDFLNSFFQSLPKTHEKWQVTHLIMFLIHYVFLK